MMEWYCIIHFWDLVKTMYSTQIYLSLVFESPAKL